MAQSPSARRARRDAYARSLTDPRTGQPFKNYNALDTYQRNLKSQARGFTSRAQERRETESAELRRVQDAFPLSWQRFLGDQRPTRELAKDFWKAFGKYPRNVSHRYRDESEELRAAYVAGMEAQGTDWDWNLWRVEYAAV
jgi:hypothetical protein